MKIKIITSLGTFTSDEITDVSFEDLQEIIKQSVVDGFAHFSMSVDGCHMYFSDEVLKNSIFQIIK